MTAPAQPVQGVEAVAVKAVIAAIEDQMPATQDMESTLICDDLERAIVAVRALPREAPAAVAEAVCPVPPLYADCCACPQHASPAPAPEAPAANLVRKALDTANSVFRFDLRRMVERGDDYNQAVKDAADRVTAALAALATQADATKGDAAE